MKFVYRLPFVLSAGWILFQGFDPIGLAQESRETPMLQEVVVTATRQEEEVLRIPSHVTVITEEEIQHSNASNMGDLLKTEAGLWVVNTSGSAPTGIFVDGRGFNNGGGNGSRVLVLIDGRRANLTDTSNPDWAVIPVESVARIEIVRGPSTALYGDNAVAGVINIITKQGAPEGRSGLSLEAGSYDLWKRTVELSGTDEALSYYLYGGYESANGYRENSDYRASNYVGNFGYKASPFMTLHVRSSYLSNERLLPGNLTEDEIAAVGRRGSVTPQDHGGTRQTQFDLRLDSYLDKDHWIELTAGRTLRREDFRITYPGSGVYDSANDGRSGAVTGKYSVTGPLAGRDSRLMLGVDLIKEKVESPSIFTDTTGTNFPDAVRYERRLIGTYAHEEFSIHPSLIMTLSGRMDWSGFQFSQESTGLSGDRSFRIWSPKAGLTYLTSPTTSLYATWSRSFRFPNRDELTGAFGFTPELDPERATTYEVGSKMQAGRNLEGAVSIYRTRVENEILLIPPDIGAFGIQNENIPEIRHEGIEVSSSVRTRETVRWNGSYTVTRSKIIEGPFDGGRLPLTPKHAGSAGMDWGSDRGWMLSLTGRFVGRRILINDLANAQEKLPAYTVMDTKLTYRGESLETYVGVNNVLDRKYEESGGVGGGLTTPFGSRIGFYPSPERNFIGGATLRF